MCATQLNEGSQPIKMSYFAHGRCTSGGLTKAAAVTVRLIVCALDEETIVRTRFG